MLRDPADPIASNNPLTLVGAVAGAAGGWLFSQYAGASLWIPGIAALLLGLLFAKTPIAPPHFRGAIAVTGGHVVWFIAGAALTGTWEVVGIDVAVLLAAIALVWAKPSPTSGLILAAVQLVSLGINGFWLLAATFGSADHRALAVHVLFRVLALVFVIAELLALRRAASPSEPPASA
ncbi:hypothetical protein ACNOYE_02370 [Nannocystaceae bacterium ST9]